MKNISCFLLISFCVFSFDSFSKPALPRFFKKYNKFLASYVDEGKVNYEAITKKEANLNELLELMATADLSKASVNEKKSFYINSYNLLVISQIVKNYPVETPYEIEGFYSDNLHKVAGQLVTLNTLEEEILLKVYKDIRIPFALCSGTLGSFPLASSAYLPEKLEKQLSGRTKLFTSDENFIRVKKNSSRVLICEAFIRCQKFSSSKELIAGLNLHREEAIPNSYYLEFYPSNRALNIVK